VATEIDRFLNLLLSAGFSLIFVALPLKGPLLVNQAEGLPAISRSSSALVHAGSWEPALSSTIVERIQLRGPHSGRNSRSTGAPPRRISPPQRLGLLGKPSTELQKTKESLETTRMNLEPEQLDWQREQLQRQRDNHQRAIEEEEQARLDEEFAEEQQRDIETPQGGAASPRRGTARKAQERRSQWLKREHQSALSTLETQCVVWIQSLTR
jgi:hypothetical protein